MKVAIWQYDIVWQDAHANFAALEEKLASLDEEVALLVAPEMLSTGFTMQPELLTLMSHAELSQKLLDLSAKYNKGIAASFAIKENDKFYNRFYFVGEGKITTYNKRHLFRMAQEHEHYESGKSNQIIVNFKGVRFLLQICYDLRFPVFSRNMQLSYDAILYVANWPKARSSAWAALLKARAIENQAYVLGSNRCGVDDNKIVYNGRSAFIDFLGESDEMIDEEGVITATINMRQLEQYRKKFPAYLDQDFFEITPD